MYKKDQMLLYRKLGDEKQRLEKFESEHPGKINKVVDSMLKYNSKLGQNS